MCTHEAVAMPQPRGASSEASRHRASGLVWRQERAGGGAEALRAVDDVLDEAHYVPLLLGMLGELAEELADHGEVVRVACALLPPRAISPTFEDPRVCVTLRNNISSVDVAKATEWWRCIPRALEEPLPAPR